MKKWKQLLLVLGLAICLPGCGAVSSDSYTTTDNAYVNSEAMGTGDGFYEASAQESYDSELSESGSDSVDVREGRKLIRTVNLDVETLEFDELLSFVQNKTAALGGYVEDMYAYNGSRYNNYSYGSTGYTRDRSATLTLRIPKDKLDDFLSELDGRGNIISRTEKEEDVTLDYVDLDSHKEVLLAEQERLLALMEQAETLEDILTLESRLSDVRYQIESMESRLRTYDNLIDYSTVYLDIEEVVELTPLEVEEPTAWQRMSEGFMESLSNIGSGIREFFIDFVICLPYLLIAFLFVGILLFVIFTAIRKSEQKQQKKLQELQKQQGVYAQQQTQQQTPAQ